MKTVGAFFANIGSPDHIHGAEGDYIGPDGRLTCGLCHTPKERLLPFNGRWVPCLCACGLRRREAEERAREEAAEEQRVYELQRYSIIDQRTKEATFETAEIRQDSVEAFRIAQTYVRRWDEIYTRDSGLNGLLFYGRPGSGKSYLAACIANALIARRVPVLMTSIVKLTSAPQDQVNDVLRQSRNARLLVLDDLGAERDTSFKLEQVFNIIDYRYASKRPLIVTTNLSMEDMRNGVDTRYSRIFERVKAMCFPVLMDGASWRQKQTAEAFEDMRRLLSGE